MPRKLTGEQQAGLAATLNEIREQSAGIHEHIDFIRDNAGRPPFGGDVATPAELLAMIQACEAEFIALAEHHVPIYLGCRLIEEFNGHWSVEQKPGMAMFGQPYVDGFGNIEYENIYLPMLRLGDAQDVRRFDRLRSTCRRAFDLRAKFIETFGELSGTVIPRSELEQQCVDLDVPPKGKEAEHVWRTRVTQYAKQLNIKIRRG